jgi:hypothetical protein
MKLSEAMERGRVFLTPVAGRFVDDSGTAGCVMGMAAIGVDAPLVLRAASSLKNVVASEIIRQRWPWLMSFRHYTLLCTCKIPNRRFGLTGWRYRALDIIIHTFDEHVAGSVTGLERLIEWVRRIEPRDPLRGIFERIPVKVPTQVAHEWGMSETTIEEIDEICV